jgi:hypothetical protein
MNPADRDLALSWNQEVLDAHFAEAKPACL